MQNVWPLLIVGLSTIIASAAEPAKFELLDGDRVVFLGNTLIEREQQYGFWELMLTMAWPERNVTFRNLGWSGDTVWGESRAGFGTQADGFKALVEQVNAAKPTVIFVGYGNVEAFDGKPGLSRFAAGLGHLLDELERTKARIVLLGPTLQAESMSLNPNVERYNRDVEHYAAVIRETANQRGHHFVDLIEASRLIHPAIAQSPFVARTTTVNGMDTTYRGYIGLWNFGIAPQLGLAGMEIGSISGKSDDPRLLLMQTIPKKNELFFHRWRPQNETYLFGFRKHEQGNNAKEVFEFDPLIAAEEKKIAELRTKLAAELMEANDAK